MKNFSASKEDLEQQEEQAAEAANKQIVESSDDGNRVVGEDVSVDSQVPENEVGTPEQTPPPMLQDSQTPPHWKELWPEKITEPQTATAPVSTGSSSPPQITEPETASTVPVSTGSSSPPQITEPETASTVPVSTGSSSPPQITEPQTATVPVSTGSSSPPHEEPVRVVEPVDSQPLNEPVPPTQQTPTKAQLEELEKEEEAHNIRSDDEELAKRQAFKESDLRGFDVLKRLGNPIYIYILYIYSTAPIYNFSPCS